MHSSGGSSDLPVRSDRCRAMGNGKAVFQNAEENSVSKAALYRCDGLKIVFSVVKIRNRFYPLARRRKSFLLPRGIKSKRSGERMGGTEGRESSTLFNMAESKRPSRAVLSFPSRDRGGEEGELDVSAITEEKNEKPPAKKPIPMLSSEGDLWGGEEGSRHTRGYFFGC